MVTPVGSPYPDSGSQTAAADREGVDPGIELADVVGADQSGVDAQRALGLHGSRERGALPGAHREEGAALDVPRVAAPVISRKPWNTRSECSTMRELASLG